MLRRILFNSIRNEEFDYCQIGNKIKDLLNSLPCFLSEKAILAVIATSFSDTDSFGEITSLNNAYDFFQTDKLLGKSDLFVNCKF